MNNNDYDLIALLQKVPTATVSLQLSDLNTFSRRLIAQTREEYEREITGRLEARNEVYLTSDAVKQTLKVGNTTLWRWAKDRDARAGTFLSNTVLSCRRT